MSARAPFKLARPSTGAPDNSQRQLNLGSLARRGSTGKPAARAAPAQQQMPPPPQMPPPGPRQVYVPNSSPELEDEEGAYYGARPGDGGDTFAYGEEMHGGDMPGSDGADDTLMLDSDVTFAPPMPAHAQQKRGMDAPSGEEPASDRKRVRAEAFFSHAPAPGPASAPPGSRPGTAQRPPSQAQQASQKYRDGTPHPRASHPHMHPPQPQHGAPQHDPRASATPAPQPAGAASVLAGFGPLTPAQEARLAGVWASERARWAAATPAEWTAGGEELKAGMGALLDRAVENVVRKTSAYAQFAGSIRAHKEKLDERGRELRQAREALVKQSTSIGAGGPGEGAGSSAESSLGSAGGSGASGKGSSPVRGGEGSDE